MAEGVECPSKGSRRGACGFDEVGSFGARRDRKKRDSVKEFIASRIFRGVLDFFAQICPLQKATQA